MSGKLCVCTNKDIAICLVRIFNFFRRVFFIVRVSNIFDKVLFLREVRSRQCFTLDNLGCLQPINKLVDENFIGLVALESCTTLHPHQVFVGEDLLDFAALLSPLCSLIIVAALFVTVA